MKTKPNVPHYTQGTIDTWDVISDWFPDKEYQAYLIGNIIKYLQRHRHKGSPVQDLNKARDYLNELIACIDSGLTSEG